MKLPIEWTEADILSLIDNQVQESLELDYKACDALQKTDSKKREVSKDVSAFANSSGGVIIYGVKEDGNIPTEIDVGFDPNVISKEWLEQVINSNVHPRLDGLIINQIELKTIKPGYVVYVVSIPQATTKAPHQAADKKYYKRFNFESVPMEDYEIRDILRRPSSPDLYFKFSLNFKNTTPVYFIPGQDFSQPIDLITIVCNRSNEPAFYAVMTIIIDSKINVIDSAGLHKNDSLLTVENEDLSVTLLRKNWNIPAMLPIFKEYNFKITDQPVKIAIPNEDCEKQENYVFGWRIDSPGMSNISIGKLILVNNCLSIDIAETILSLKGDTYKLVS